MKHKLINLLKTVKYVYSKDPWMCAFRDGAFVLITGLEIYAISVGGKFIDGTADIILDWEEFDLGRYLESNSFQYLIVGLALWVLIHLLSRGRQYAGARITRVVFYQAEYDVMHKTATENLQEVEQSRFQEYSTFVPTYSIPRLYTIYDRFSEVIRHLVTVTSALIIASQYMGVSVVFILLISFMEPLMLYVADRNLRDFRKAGIEGVRLVDHFRNLSQMLPYFAELRINQAFAQLKKGYLDGQVFYQEGLISRFKYKEAVGGVWAVIGQTLIHLYYVYIILIVVIERLSIGEFKMLYDYAAKGYSSSFQFWRNLTLIYDELGYTEDFFELLDYEGFGDIQPGDKELRVGVPKLEVRDLDFAYPYSDGRKPVGSAPRKALNGVNMTIEPGQRVAFVGTDGAGKSSLIKTLCGLYEIMDGDYLIEGISVRELKRGELKSKISIIMQDFVRYFLTVEENITHNFDGNKVNYERYEEVKKIAKVTDFLREEGMDDKQVLGKLFPGGRDISPGYWQRLAIARLLYREADIYILDEPFIYIDSAIEIEILNDILQFLKGKTVILITKDEALLKEFDAIYYFREGRVVESGTYKDLVRMKGDFYRDLNLKDD